MNLPTVLIKRVNPNGYGASVILLPETGLYEVAVTDRDGALVYDTPVTDRGGVRRVATIHGVAAILDEIAALPPRA